MNRKITIFNLKIPLINIIVLLVILLATFLRLYKIGDYMTFLGDEGRDVLVAKHILEGNITFIGPRASAGDFFLGPVYYYFITPFLLLFNYDPVGPAVMIALSSIVTVFLIYKFGREFFGVKAALIASLLYAIAPVVLRYSRASWNPNLMPIVSLLIIYFLYKGVTEKMWKYYLLVGLLFGIAMQLHYIEVFMAVIIFVFFIAANIIIQKKVVIVDLVKNALIMLSGFIVTMSPFLAFEIKNNFPNSKTIISFVLGSSDDKYDMKTTFIGVVYDVFFRLFGRLVTNFPDEYTMHLFGNSVLRVWEVAVLALALLSIFALFKLKNKIVVLLFSLWLFLGVILFGFYKKPIFDYYFQFMFPLPFLLVGNLFSTMLKNKLLYVKIFSVVILLVIVIRNLYGMPQLSAPNKQKDQIKNITEFVASKTDDIPFNFAIISPANSDHGYRYYFEINKRPVVEILPEQIDPQRKSTTKYLFIVCEDINCQPEGYGTFEVAGFGRAKIVESWNYSVVKVYKLRHLTKMEMDEIDKNNNKVDKS